MWSLVFFTNWKQWSNKKKTESDSAGEAARHANMKQFLAHTHSGWFKLPQLISNMFLVLYSNVYLFTVSTFHYWQEACPLFSTALIPKFASFEVNGMSELFLHTSRGSKWWCAKTWSCSLCLKLACFFSILHTSHSLSRFYCVVRRHVWSKYSL